MSLYEAQITRYCDIATYLTSDMPDTDRSGCNIRHSYRATKLEAIKKLLSLYLLFVSSKNSCKERKREEKKESLWQLYLACHLACDAEPALERAPNSISWLSGQNFLAWCALLVMTQSILLHSMVIKNFS